MRMLYPQDLPTYIQSPEHHMAPLDPMQGMIKGYLASPKGQQTVRNYLNSPEGQAAIDAYLATPGGQQMARLLLSRSLDRLDLPDEIKVRVKEAL